PRPLLLSPSFPCTTLFRSSLRSVSYARTTVPSTPPHPTTNCGRGARRISQVRSCARYLGDDRFDGTPQCIFRLLHLAHVPQLSEDRKSTRLNSSHVSISYA